MGEWNPASHAFMIHTMHGKVLMGDPAKPTIPAIYKIRAEQVEAFKAKYDRFGAVWIPHYSMQDFTKDDFSPHPLLEDDNEQDADTD